ncbi:hypothetical protein [Catenuloplanes japonicus]|uniref:hypothetical protein n=1 Tax=Catenuloplanes japonicus TaxID=33876 RepID=UPI0005253321|nr:hypothetical protein [Catenuloplanes japonicus]
MSLTGRPLIVLAALVTLLALGATVLLWRRSGRWRLVVRPLGVLLVEALLIITCGLWANRHAQFYPTWSALLASGGSGQASYPKPVGALDRWVADHAPPDGTFAWEPAGWEGWHLTQAPTVTLPPDYAAHPDRTFSAVVIVGGAGTPAPDDARLADDHHRGSGTPAREGVVLIIVPVTVATPPEVLATALPAAVTHDLRVTGQRWAMVAPTAAVLATSVAAIGLAAARYPAFAVVSTDKNAAAGTNSSTDESPGTDTGAATGAGTTATTCTTTAAAVGADRGTSAGAVTTLPAGVDVHCAATLPAAVDWAVSQTPPPLVPGAPADQEGRPHGAEQSRR